ncbi:MAG: low molecular weight protein arginine phosphatase [Candidatus Bathyarchaeia archaeon]
MKILFVCSGNMCRSPMAEGLARKMLEEQADSESAGTHALDGTPATVEAITVMHSMFGIDISSHRSRNVKDVPLDDFDYIVPMDATVADDLRRDYPSITARLLNPWNIDDPFHRGAAVYERRTAREIQKHVAELPIILNDLAKKLRVEDGSGSGGI